MSLPSESSAQPETKAESLKISSAILRGAIGFAAVSVAGFAVWAVGGKWLYARIGEAGLYAVSAIVFIVLSGVVLHPLVLGPNSLVRFYKIFVPAFVVYAIVWCACWFAGGFGRGEWLASIVGSIGFVAMVARGLGKLRSFEDFRFFVPAAIVMIILHSAGYFLGGRVMHWFGSPDAAKLLNGLSKAQISLLAKLAWGFIYGLGFGAGLGCAFFKFQESPPRA